MTRALVLWALVISCFAYLTACGGGGGEDSGAGGGGSLELLSWDNGNWDATKWQ